jgi:DNA helicase HerA-like ATPase
MPGLYIGRDKHENQPLYISFARPRSVLIAGKRGSGKSYSLGVLLEELILTHPEALVIVVDPMGIYHTMAEPNIVQLDQLYDWGLAEQSFPINLVIPGLAQDLYDPDIFETLMSRPNTRITQLKLNANDLSPEGWCDFWDLPATKPMGIALFRAVSSLKMRGGFFNLDDILHRLDTDPRIRDDTKLALSNRIYTAKQWHIFSDLHETDILEVFLPGWINVIDLSRLDPGRESLRNLIVSLVARSLFRARSDDRHREEFGKLPRLGRVWLAIDEAHQFAPAHGATLAKEDLIRWVKEGRQPGLGIILATQQPSALTYEILSQCDLLICHKLTTRDDVTSLNNLSHEYMPQELRSYIKMLENVGEAVLVDDDAENVKVVTIRPRKSRHGGDHSPVKTRDYT